MDLSGFDPSTMTYLATQMQHPNAGNGQDPFQEMLLPTEFNDHHSTYGGYAGYVQKANLHVLELRGCIIDFGPSRITLC